MSTKITYHKIEKEIELKGEKSILELVREHFEYSFSACAKRGGEGSCGRCVCLIRSADGSERRALACCTMPADGDVISCLFEEGYAAGELRVVTEDGLHNEGKTIESSKNPEDLSLHNIGELIDEVPDVRKNFEEYSLHNSDCKDGEGSLHNLAAIDLGSTTVVFKAGDRVYTCLNPQRAWGSDVVSRISASAGGDRERLRDVTIECIRQGLRELSRGGRITGAVLAGNTAMLHLLMGYGCEGLGRAPFKPYSTHSESFELDGRRIVTAPGVSAFIGGDIVTGLWYLEDMLRSDETAKNKCYLYIDLGTNAEIVLKKDDVFYAASAAAGSVFDGGASGLMGADLIHLAAEALRADAMDETGLLAEEYFDEGYCVSEQNENGLHKMTLTEKAVRELQLAKAAIYCGVDSLLQGRGRYDEVEAVYVAGGMGYFLRAEDVFEIAMLPQELKGKVRIVGNLCLAGGSRVAGNINNGSDKKLEEVLSEMRDIVKRTHVISLPDLDSFGEKYINSLNF